MTVFKGVKGASSLYPNEINAILGDINNLLEMLHYKEGSLLHSKVEINQLICSILGPLPDSD